jgi:ubiquinone/menaquinone biosynthesis C-methylase UbiE
MVGKLENKQSSKSANTKSGKLENKQSGKLENKQSGKSANTKSGKQSGKSKKLATSLSTYITDTRETLIQKDKYFKFIDITHKHEIEDRNCLVEMLKNYYIHFNYNYPIITSNKQFQYYILECFKNNYIDHLNRLIVLLSSYLVLDDIYFLINMLKVLNIQTDDQVYSYIKSKKHKIKKNKNIYTTCSRLDVGFERIYENCKKYIIPSSNYNYLDFGCGNGYKTLKFQKLFKIPLANTYGTDIKNWGPYDKERKFNFHFKFLGENNKIEFKDNTFDLVTCFLALHHIPNLTDTINEIKRVLKPNGLLFILDHNVFIPLDSIILDIQHNLYAYINNEPNKDTFNRFFNYLEWDYILHNLGFHYKVGKDYFETVNLAIRFDYQFYGLYQKHFLPVYKKAF